MDFTLVPICSEKEHELEYDYKKSYKCDICYKNNVSYRCINCEYSRCSKCHRNILGEQEIKQRLRHIKIKNNIKMAENKLKDDKLDDWEVMVVDGEICYINKLSRTYSYDYPLSAKPTLSPQTEISSVEIPYTPESLSTPESLPTPIPEKDDSQDTYNYHIRCTFTEIYNSIKSLF